MLRCVVSCYVVLCLMCQTLTCKTQCRSVREEREKREGRRARSKKDIKDIRAQIRLVCKAPDESAKGYSSGEGRGEKRGQRGQREERERRKGKGRGESTCSDARIRLAWESADENVK